MNIPLTEALKFWRNLRASVLAAPCAAMGLLTGLA